MTATVLVAALLAVFAAVMAATCREIRRHTARGRHHLLLRTRVRVHLGRRPR